VPNRILREGILTSPRIAKLGWAEEVFYRRLHSVVDDFGRYFADVGLLRAACYPRQLNKVSDSDIGKWLTALVEAALVRVYPAQDGERYLELLDFRQQVRAKESKFPSPPSTCVADAAQPPADAHLDVSVSVSEDVGVSRASAAPAPRGKKTPKAGLPEDFGVSERVRAWATEKGYGQLPEHLEAFKRKAAANGYTYADWDAAFMEAIREDWAKLRGKRSDGSAPPPEAKRPERDPALVKIEEDAKRARGPSLEELERLARIRQGAKA
jgi:hypothetical protein